MAGLDAGLTYNEFPLMGGRLVPTDLMAYKPAISNITENPTTVQFNHRLLVGTALSNITENPTTVHFNHRLLVGTALSNITRTSLRTPARSRSTSACYWVVGTAALLCVDRIAYIA